jgi:hypothetical protein
VTLVEYGDFECPYCGQAEPFVRALLDNFGDSDTSGDTRLLPSDLRASLIRQPTSPTPPDGSARRMVRKSRWEVITRASQAAPSNQAKITSVSQWWPRNTRLRPMANAQTKATITAAARAHRVRSRRTNNDRSRPAGQITAADVLLGEGVVCQLHRAQSSGRVGVLRGIGRQSRVVPGIS